jgi:hypothetical protein
MLNTMADSRKVKLSGLTKAHAGAEKGTGQAGEQRAHGIGQQLELEGVDAHQFGGGFIFTDGFPGPADP